MTCLVPGKLMHSGWCLQCRRCSHVRRLTAVPQRPWAVDLWVPLHCRAAAGGPEHVRS